VEGITMKNIISMKKGDRYSMFLQNSRLTRSVFLVLTIFLLTPWYLFGQENTSEKTLIIYHSRTVLSQRCFKENTKTKTISISCKEK
jgi:hypothetical protein